MRALSTLLLLLAAAVRADTLPLLNPYWFSPVIVANTAVFDGINDRLAITGTATGLASSKTVTVSFWIRLDGKDGQELTIFSPYGGGNFYLWLMRGTDNKLRIRGEDTSGILRLDGTATAATLTVASGWTHVLWCVDMANASNRHLYVNGTDTAVTWTTYTDATLGMGLAGVVYLGSDPSDDNPRIQAAFCEFWIDDVYLDDPTKFRSASGHPISLGSNGELPTGSAPAIYLSLVGGGNSWAQDSSGNGNNFTVTGTLGTTTSP